MKPSTYFGICALAAILLTVIPCAIFYMVLHPFQLFWISSLGLSTEPTRLWITLGLTFGGLCFLMFFMMKYLGESLSRKKSSKIFEGFATIWAVVFVAGIIVSGGASMDMSPAIHFWAAMLYFFAPFGMGFNLMIASIIEKGYKKAACYAMIPVVTVLIIVIGAIMITFGLAGYISILEWVHFAALIAWFAGMVK